MGEPFGYCLNMGTIRKQAPGIVEQVETAAAAGYGAIEPWMDSLDAYRKAGGKLKELGKRIADAGLAVPSAIGFAQWLVDRADRRAKGLEQAKRDMDTLRQIGGTAIAAPASGMIHRRGLDPLVAAERYRALLELGDRMGVVPMVELWGFSTALCRMGEVAAIAVEAAHPSACILLDVYHIYKGGSDHAGVRVLNGAGLRVVHMNDYPAKPARAKITDADRVYPGDGVAPLGQFIRDLKDIGFSGWLSLELFNEAYYRQPADKVARTGLAKMKAAVAKAMKA